MTFVFKREILDGVTRLGVSANDAIGIDVLDGYTDDELIANMYINQLSILKLFQVPVASDTVRLYQMEGSPLENRETLASMGIVPEKQLMVYSSEDRRVRLCTSAYAIEFVTSVLPIDGSYFGGVLRTLILNIVWLFTLSIYEIMWNNIAMRDIVDEGLCKIFEHILNIIESGTVDKIKYCKYMLFGKEPYEKV